MIASAWIWAGGPWGAACGAGAAGLVGGRARHMAHGNTDRRLLVFGAVFAINSALHSYLILAFTQAERVTMDVGFYYMANAAGRLLGTLLSGLSYQLGGLPACLGTAAVMLVLSAILARRFAARAA